MPTFSYASETIFFMNIIYKEKGAMALKTVSCAGRDEIGKAGCSGKVDDLSKLLYGVHLCLRQREGGHPVFMTQDALQPRKEKEI